MLPDAAYVHRANAVDSISNLILYLYAILRMLLAHNVPSCLYA